jgi:hypothetical protein
VNALNYNVNYLDNFDYSVAVAEAMQDFDTSFQSASQSDYESLCIIGKTNGTFIDLSEYEPEVYFYCKDNRFFAKFNSSEMMNTCFDRLNADESVLCVSKDELLYSCYEELDEDTNLSWGVKKIEADIYSDYLQQQNFDKEVVVAIIDSGVADLDAFEGKLVPGYDFEDNDYDTTNDIHPDSHGTFLASIIVDCVKMCPIKIMPIRVMSSVSGSLINIVNGIYYAVDNGADVINISLGGRISDCRVVDDALRYAAEKDVVTVVCAGNTAKSVEDYCPAHNESAITVTAVDSENIFASRFSNYGSTVDIVAPGVAINGFNANGGIKTLNGTSMSTAFISACVAMIRLTHPELNVYQIDKLLEYICLDLGDEGWDELYGHGIPKLSMINELQNVWVSGIQSDKTKSIFQGDSAILDYSIQPVDATNQQIVCVSSDNDVVIIDENAKLYAVGLGSAEVTIETLDGKYKSVCKVNVISKTPVSVSIVALPDKLKYKYGEELTLDGMILSSMYSDGSKKIVTDTSLFDCSEFNSKKAGNKTIIVTYEECSVSFVVFVELSWWQKLLRLISFVWLF